MRVNGKMENRMELEYQKQKKEINTQAAEQTAYLMEAENISSEMVICIKELGYKGKKMEKENISLKTEINISGNGKKDRKMGMGTIITMIILSITGNLRMGNEMGRGLIQI